MVWSSLSYAVSLVKRSSGRPLLPVMTYINFRPHPPSLLPLLRVRLRGVTAVAQRLDVAETESVPTVPQCHEVVYVLAGRNAAGLADGLPEQR